MSEQKITIEVIDGKIKTETTLNSRAEVIGLLVLEIVNQVVASYTVVKQETPKNDSPE